MYTLADGEYLVRMARRTIEARLRGGKPPSPGHVEARLKERAGVFVTLETYPESALRGCIGYPEPVMPLVEALPKAAVSAAVSDPRFPPLEEGEMEGILVEVTLLTRPELLRAKPMEYPSKIEIGRHGLIAERGFSRGLLLPQVAVDQGWDTEEFLSHTCMKAGLLPDAWLDKATKVYRFQGIVFAEVTPRGEVVERKLG